MSSLPRKRPGVCACNAVTCTQVITITAKAGAEGKLFGSVTAADVVEAVEAQTGVVLDRRTLSLDEHIKTIGTHSVPAKLHTDVQFPITVEVEPA